MAAPAALVEAGVAVSVGVVTVVLPGAEVVLGVCWMPQLVAPSSVPSPRYDRRLGAPLYPNLLLAFKPESQRAPQSRTTDPTRSFPHLEFITQQPNLVVRIWLPVDIVDYLGDGLQLNIVRMFLR